MSTKVTAKIKTSATPTPTIATKLAPSRPFSDRLTDGEETTSDRTSTAATPPPPEIQRDRPTQGYNFSRISVSNYIPATIQTKLVVGAPGDKYEQEADNMADKVMSMTAPATIQRQDEDEEIQAKLSTDIQRQENEEINLKSLGETIQRQEEDEGINLKPLTESIQRQEEDEGISLKPLADTIQRQEEDEGINLKPLTESIQRQEEDEGISLKPLADTIQRQEEDEGINLKPLTESIQRQEEDEGISLKPLADTIQRQEDEGINLKPLTESIQRQEEDEGISLKPLSQIQRTEDEGINLKPLDNEANPVLPIKTPKPTVKLVSRKAKNNGAFEASQGVESRIKSKSGGSPLPGETRDFMESRFGNDFSQVKIHTDSESVQMNKELGAQAFTHGKDIYFNSGKYNPGSGSGKKLLAHELTHTIQQTGAIKRKTKNKSSIQNKIQRKVEQAPTTQKIQTEEEKKAKNAEEEKEKANKNADTAAKAFIDKLLSQEELQKKLQEVNDLNKIVTFARLVGYSTTAEALKPHWENIKKTNEQVAAEEAKKQEASKDENAKEGETEKKEGEATTGGETVAGGEKEGGTTTETNAPKEPISVTIPTVTGKAPTSPEEDPAYQAVVKQSENVVEQQKQHPNPETKAQQAQEGAEDPTKQMRDAQATQVDAVNQKEPKPFDRASFEQKLLEKLDLIKPKNLKDADNFSNNGAVGDVKNQLDSQVKTSKDQSANGLPEATQAPPKPDAEQPKSVTPIPDIAQDLGNKPPAIEADKAVPKEKAKEEIEKPMEETGKNLDKAFGNIQTKLVVGAPGDKYEQEADQMADRVMAMPDSAAKEEAKTKEDSSSQNPKSIQNSKFKIQKQDTQFPEPNDQHQTLRLKPLAEIIQRHPDLKIQRKESTLEATKVEQPVPEVPMDTKKLETFKEVGGGQALTSLKTAKKNTVEGPKDYRIGEEETVNTAKTDAVQTATDTNEAMFGDRAASMDQVATSQQNTKSVDEQNRAKVTQDIQGIYDETKASVDARLKKLDDDVNQEFKRGSQAAKQKFEGYVQQQMKAYKKDRYSGFWGPAKWLKDKFLGMPDAVNKFYEDGKNIYIEEMKASISAIATIVETGLTEAKALVDNGRKRVQDYVTGLSEDLKKIGADAALEVQSKFDSLEQSVNDKQSQLLDSLAEKYQANLKELDKRIDKLKSENKGLLDKVLDAIADAAKWILKTLVRPIAKLLEPFIGDMAVKVIDSIIEDPVKFMKNLFKGIGDGIKNFATNIGKHLLNGLTTWLFGNIGGEIKLPEKFDLQGFLDLLLQVLGLSKEFLFGLAAKHLGDNVFALIKFITEFVIEHGLNSLNVVWDIAKMVGTVGVDVVMGLIENGKEFIEDLPSDTQELIGSVGGSIEAIISFGGDLLGALGDGALELISGIGTGAKFVFEFFSTLFTEGVTGLWEFLKSSVDTLKQMFMSELSTMLIVEVVKQGIIWIASLLFPASGIIKIIKGVIDVITFFIEKKDEIKELVNTILGTLKSIVEGNPAGMAKMIEQALASAIPVVLGFLASLLGIGGIPAKIKKIFDKIRAPITKVVDGFFNKIKGFFSGLKKSAKKAWKKTKKKVKGAFKGKKDKNKEKNKDNAKQRIKAAANEAQEVAKTTRDPKQVKEKLSGIQTNHKLDKLKLKKKGKKKYQIIGKTKRIKVQKKAESTVVQLKESPWKNPKNKVIVKNKVKGSKKKANFTLTAKLIDKGKILQKVATKLKKLIKKKVKATSVETALAPIQQQYELKSLSVQEASKDGKQYQVVAQTPPEEGGTKAQKQEIPGATGNVETGVETAIQRSVGQGQTLSNPVREPMEQAFGCNFGNVRIHADSEGDRLSRSLEARAFTTGSDIFFRSGAYAPNSNGGKRLLAHELTHVVQQSGEEPSVTNSDRTEAGSGANRLFQTYTVQRQGDAPPPTPTRFIQREPEQPQSDQKPSEKKPSKAKAYALMGASVALTVGAQAIGSLGSSSSVDVSKKISGNTLTMKVKITEKAEKKQEEKAATAEKPGLTQELVGDIVKLIQEIVNQSPDPETVQKKLDKVRMQFDLDLLKVVSSATIGQSFTYDIKIKGGTKPSQEKDFASVVKNLATVDKKKDDVEIKEDKPKPSKEKVEEKNPITSKEKPKEEPKTTKQEPKKPKEEPKKPKEEKLEESVKEKIELIKEDPEKTEQKAQKPGQPKAELALDVNTKVNRVDDYTVDVSVRADSKKR